MNNHIVLIGLAAFILVLLCGIIYVLVSGGKKSAKSEKKADTAVKKIDMTDREILMTKHVTVTVTRKVTPLNELAESEMGKNLEMDDSVNDQMITVDIDFDDCDSEDIGFDDEENSKMSVDDPAILKSIFDSLAKSNERELEKRSVPEGFTMPPTDLDALQQSLDGIESDDTDNAEEQDGGSIEFYSDDLAGEASESGTDTEPAEDSSKFDEQIEENGDEINEIGNFSDGFEEDMKGFVTNEEKPEEPGF